MDMVTKSRVLNALRNPKLFLRYLNRLYFSRFHTQDINVDGVKIFDVDWDNLIILDACRYDMFEEYNMIPGELQFRYSRGSTTSEFLRGNLVNSSLEDTVYITANPQYYNNGETLSGQFYDTINIWKDEGWNETFNTVLPETTRQYAERVAEEYPNKRLVIHFIQPHYPFLDSEVDFDKKQLHKSENKRAFWNEIFVGELEIQEEEIWKLYNDNLRKVLKEVDTLTKRLNGRTIITSDHGNMIGERSFPIPIKEWGHPPGTYTEPLIKVPWLINEDGTRKDIISKTPKQSEEEIDQGKVAEQLEHLGYVE